MAESKRSGAELLEEEYEEDAVLESDPMQTPFNQTVDILATTGGPKLELFCRSNKPLVEAAEVCYNMAYRFHSNYIMGRMNQIMRFSVSANGQGRGELVTALQAGSGVPDSFYDAQGNNSIGFTSE